MKKLLLIFVLLVLFGCKAYEPPKQYNFIRELEFDLNYDDTWTRVITFFANSGIPTKTIDKASGIVITETMDASGLPQIMDCGTPAEGLDLFKFENPTALFNVQVVKASENKTKVRINTFYKTLYNRYSLNNGMWVKTGSTLLNCNSTGVFEALIFNYIANNK